MPARRSVQLDRLILAGEHPVALMGQIAWRFRQLAGAARIALQMQAAGERVNLRQTLTQVGVKNWQGAMEKAEANLRQLGRPPRGQALSLVAQSRFGASKAQAPRATAPASSSNNSSSACRSNSRLGRRPCGPKPWRGASGNSTANPIQALTCQQLQAKPVHRLEFFGELHLGLARRQNVEQIRQLSASAHNLVGCRVFELATDVNTIFCVEEKCNSLVRRHRAARQCLDDPQIDRRQSGQFLLPRPAGPAQERCKAEFRRVRCGCHELNFMLAIWPAECLRRFRRGQVWNGNSTRTLRNVRDLDWCMPRYSTKLPLPIICATSANHEDH